MNTCVKLTKKHEKDLLHLTKELGTTKSEVIKKSISLLSLLNKFKKEGSNFYYKRDGKITELLIIL